MQWILKAPNSFVEKYGDTVDIFGQKIVDGVVEVKQQFYAKFFEKSGFKILQEGKVEFKDPKRILILRGGGFGDMVMCLPAISALKHEYPEAEVDIWCPVVVGPILQEHPDIHEVVHWFPQYVGLNAALYDIVVDFSTIIPSNIEAEYKNAYDLHFEWLGFNPDEYDLQPKLHYSDEEEEHLLNGLKPFNINLEADSVVICCFNSSSIIRNYPFDKAREVINLLAKRYPEKKFLLIGDVAEDIERCHRFNCSRCGTELIVALDTMPTVPVEAPYYCTKCNHPIHILPANWTGGGESKDVTYWYTLPPNLYTITMSARDLIIAISRADLVISVDTAPLHFAGAVGTPSLGIFSSFLGELRVGHFPEASIIQGEYKCAPCFQHGIPCGNARRQGKTHALCMDAIKPERIANAAQSVLQNEQYYERKVNVEPSDIAQTCPICRLKNTTPKHRKGDFFHYACKDCECLFIRPKPAGEYLTQMYGEEDYLTVYLEKEGVKQYAEYFAAELSTMYPIGRLLEIGSSVGWFLAAAHKKGWDVTGVETSLKACDIACKLPGLEKAVIQGSILDNSTWNKVVAYSDKQVGNLFDLIVLHQTLEHFDEPVELIRKLTPLLTKGGKFSIVVPDLGQSIGNTEWGHLNGTFAGEHITLFTMETMKKLAEICELEIIHSEILTDSQDFWVVLQQQK